MDIFDKFRPLAETRNALARLGGEFFTIVLEDITSPTEAVVNGRPTLLAGTNNYLGLTFDPECIRASCLAAEREGTGTTGSRMANGTYAGHLALEQELSAFFGRTRTIVFATGYLANLAVTPTLAPGRDDAIFADRLNHASLIDAVQLSRARHHRYPHNDMAALERLLAASDARQRDALLALFDRSEAYAQWRGEADALAQGLAALIYRDDIEQHFAKLQTYAEPELDGSEWTPADPAARIQTLSSSQTREQ